MPRSISRFRRSTTIITLVAGVGLASTGCSLTPDPPPGRQVNYARPFPAGLEQTEQVDVQVQRDSTEITFTNTTATSFPPATMWLNRRFSRPVPSLGVGETITLKLRDFVDENNERFRAGGFFATDLPADLVLAQLETVRNDQVALVGFVVVNGSGVEQ
ncbi:MAG: hypothetical protein AAF747_02650 [Planctomycetota bacterium]